MLLALQIIVPVLLFACILIVGYVLHLFGNLPRVTWSSLLTLSGVTASSVALIGFVIYLYTGFNISDPGSLPTIRQFFIDNVLHNSGLLLALCLLFMFTLMISLYLGIRSETIELITNISVATQVSREDGKLIGTISEIHPLRRRFPERNRLLKFHANGFDQQ